VIFSQDRRELRTLFSTAWSRYRQQQPLEPLQQLIAEIVKFHPEYHQYVENPERYSDHDWLPEHGDSNPFLHMAMHIGIQEQLGTDRPAGFRRLYQRLVERHQHPHPAEHEIMECLAEGLWQAMAEVQDYSERRIRAGVEEIPDGTYTGEARILIR